MLQLSYASLPSKRDFTAQNKAAEKRNKAAG